MYFENPFSGASPRMKMFPVLLTAGLVILASAVWRTQVPHGAEMQTRLDRQSVRRIRLPPVRGKIFDRHGVCLADNRPSYRIGLFPEELRRPGGMGRTVDAVLETADRISRLIGNDSMLTPEKVVRHLRTRQPLFLVGWEDVDPQTMAAFAERAYGVPAADIDVDPKRIYPYGWATAHVVGYVGQPDASQATDLRDYHFYVPNQVGKSGVEASLDRALAGDAGGQLVRVDASGYRFSEIGGRPAVPGQHAVLALDLDVQREVEGIMREHVGAAVVVSPADGDVLALVSSPAFDANDLVSPVARTVWAALSTDERHPLMNRAVSGQYMPGSTMKPIVALAGLAAGTIDPGTRVFCSGRYAVGNRFFHCWNRNGHGSLNLREALRYSCNVYFYQTGVTSGPEAIEAMARAFGLGDVTGIEIPAEQAGLVRRPMGRRVQWYDGDTANLSIGQGRILVTPIQMAVVAATLANGGTVFHPRLVLRIEGRDGRPVQSFPPRAARRIDVDPSWIQAVREGMLQVVQAPDGTGRAAAVAGIEVAGKTGTVERGSNTEAKDTWFIGFAPFNAPRYAVAVLIEGGESGGRTAAPIGGQILGRLLRRSPGGAA